MDLNIIDLKNKEYLKALAIQESLQKMRMQDEVSDCLVLVEHPAVLTMGKRGQSDNVLASEALLEREGIDTVWVNRGGDVTYHGPGQIVGYPIFHLAQNSIGIRVFVEKIQQTIIDYLMSEHGIHAQRQTGVHTGVWVGDKKICAIGISVSRNVTMHGFAFNVNTNLDHFSYINPCGLGVGKVTSLKEILGKEIDFEQAKAAVAKSFCNVFGATPVEADADALLGEI
jgi:lipoyl(octanoyl) transferase